jgi:hypothetical protein
MIVLNPTDTTHGFNFIPRFIPSDELILQLYNETLQTTQTIDNTYVYLDGIITMTFDLDCTESQKFQVKILEGTQVIYRDKIFVTSQDTQAFKATKDHYYYE